MFNKLGDELKQQQPCQLFRACRPKQTNSWAKIWWVKTLNHSKKKKKKVFTGMKFRTAPQREHSALIISKLTSSLRLNRKDKVDYFWQRRKTLNELSWQFSNSYKSTLVLFYCNWRFLKSWIEQGGINVLQMYKILWGVRWRGEKARVFHMINKSPIFSYYQT